MLGALAIRECSSADLSACSVTVPPRYVALSTCCSLTRSENDISVAVHVYRLHVALLSFILYVAFSVSISLMIMVTALDLFPIINVSSA